MLARKHASYRQHRLRQGTRSSLWPSTLLKTRLMQFFSASQISMERRSMLSGSWPSIRLGITTSVPSPFMIQRSVGKWSKRKTVSSWSVLPFCLFLTMSLRAATRRDTQDPCQNPSTHQGRWRDGKLVKRDTGEDDTKGLRDSGHQIPGGTCVKPCGSDGLSKDCGLCPAGGMSN